jgi:hypothetical protein
MEGRFAPGSVCNGWKVKSVNHKGHEGSPREAFTAKFAKNSQRAQMGESSNRSLHLRGRDSLFALVSGGEDFVELRTATEIIQQGIGE